MTGKRKRETEKRKDRRRGGKREREHDERRERKREYENPITSK